jgi:uncharacterized membrane protein
MNKHKIFCGFLAKAAIVLALPILYSTFIVSLFKAQIWFAPSLAVFLLVAMLLAIVALMIRMPKPKFRGAIVPAFGFFGAYNRVDPSVQLLILCFHIEIGMK